MSSWVIPGLIGVMTAVSGSLIELGVQLLFTWRHGVCEGKKGRWWYEVSDQKYFGKHGV